MKRPQALVLLIILGLLVAGIAATSLAAWKSAAHVAVPPISSGTLRLASTGAMGVDGPVWFDVSQSGKTAQIDPKTFLASAGDTLRMGHYFDLEAVGDNLTYDLAIDWEAAPSLGAGVSAVYTLTENPNDPAHKVTHIQRAPLGNKVILPQAAPGPRSFLMDVELHYAKDRADLTASEVGLTDIGTIIVSAVQTRKEGES